MSLSPGAKLGPYEIGALIGVGGMGQVFKAVDPRLGRQVAIKVLPPEFSADPERLSRFEQEARAAAALNHPHIAAVYDIGVQDHTQYIVQEYLDGASLRACLIERRDRPIAEWLTIASDIASALATAHQTGIVHRDIKPENVMVSREGRAKVLDFGLAKLIEPAGAGAVDANSPTALGTVVGAVMGTAGYLAPEQAAGQPVDRRADIFSLGCILYEMAAGERPFAGRSVAETIARVLHDEPRPLAEIKPNTPPEFQRIVGKCLAKDPARRYQHADDLALDLHDLAARPASVPAPRTGDAARTTTAARWLWPLATTTLAGLAVWGWLHPKPEAQPQPASRLAVVVPNYGGASTAIQRQIAITPDGSTLLFPAIAGDGVNRTMRLALDEADPSPLPGVVPFLGDYIISADGREFLGNTSRRMFRYSIAGGNPRPLPEDLQTTPHAVWSEDGSIWFRSLNEDAGLLHLAVDGTVSKRFGREHFGLAPMCILPGGRTAVVVRTPFGATTGPAVLLDLESGQTSPLIDRDVVEVRCTSGYLVYAIADGTLYASAFDASTGRVSGAPVIIATGVAIGGNNTAQFAAARNGTVVYIPEETRSLVLIGRDGSIRPATAERRNFHAPMFSPDGRRIALDFNAPDGRDVWLLNITDGLLSRATFDRDGHDAVWTPDGRALSYTSVRKGILTLMRTRVDESQTSEVLLTSAQLGYGGVWMPDASALITVANSVESGADLAWVRGAGRGPIEPLLGSRFNEEFPAVSSDGRWLAFVSDQSGQNQVYVRSLTGTSDQVQVQVSVSGGTEPGWSRNGRELFYRTGAGLGSQFIVASVDVSPVLEVKARRTLFPVTDMVTSTPHRNWDVSPDGQSFAMVRFNPSTRIMVIQQLAALVARRQGAAR